MAETTTTTLTKHFADTLPSGKTKHSFLGANDVRYTTFKAAIAATAQALVGQPVEVTYTVQQNGEYQNIYLEAVKAANGGVADLGIVGTAVNPAPGSSMTQTPIADARQESIQRQTSVKTAFEYGASAGLDSATCFGLADEILNWIEGTTEL